MAKHTKKILPFIGDIRQLPASTTTFIAAAFLHMDSEIVAKLCRRGELKAAMVARSWKIPKENLVAYSRGLPQPIEVASHVEALRIDPM